jgi:hypothetical protein
MTVYATRKRGAVQAAAALKRYDREAATHLAAIRDARAAAGAAADAQRAARDAAAHCDIASIEPGDTVRDRYGWNLVTRVNVTTVTVRGPFGSERIPLERIIETRKAAA